MNNDTSANASSIQMSLNGIYTRYGTVVILNLIAIPFALVMSAMTEIYWALFLDLIVLTYNAYTHWFMVRVAPQASAKEIDRITFLPIYGDAFIFTVLIHFSGGLISPFTYLFLLPIITAGLVTSRSPQLAIYYTLTISLLYSSLLALEYFQVVPFVTRIPWIEMMYGNGALIGTYAILVPLIFFTFTTSAVSTGKKLWGMGSKISTLESQLEKKLEDTNAELYQRNKELETSLKERQAMEDKILRISQAVDTASDAIAMADAAGQHIYQNNSFTSMFGYSQAEIAKAGPTTLYVNANTARAMFEAIRSGRSWQGEVEMKTKSGVVKQILLRSDAIKDEHSKVLALVGFHTDMTDRKKAEAAEKRHTEEIEKMNKFMVGRETDMVGMKKEIDSLLKELGRPEKYKT